jgi:adenylylsulfate kinase
MSNKMLLLMGLPGSGKTTFALKIQAEFNNRGVLVNWFNADEVRKKFDDWDFSEEGRMRQAQRMRDLCNESDTEINMVDMVAPLPEMRTTLDADWLIWMHTIEEGRFEDTNKAFVAPDIKQVNMKFPKWGTERDAQDIVSMVLEKYGTSL